MRFLVCLFLFSSVFSFAESEVQALQGKWHYSPSELVEFYQEDDADLMRHSFQSFDPQGRVIVERVAIYTYIVDGYGSLNLTTLSHTMKFNRLREVDIHNHNNYCGASNWEIGVARYVNGKTCGNEKIPSRLDRFYNFYEYEQTKLIIGSPMSFLQPGVTNPNERPDEGTWDYVRE